MCWPPAPAPGGPWPQSPWRRTDGSRCTAWRCLLPSNAAFQRRRFFHHTTSAPLRHRQKQQKSAPRLCTGGTLLPGQGRAAARPAGPYMFRAPESASPSEMNSSSAFCCASINLACSRRRDSSASVMALKSNSYSLETFCIWYSSFLNRHKIWKLPLSYTRAARNSV